MGKVSQESINNNKTLDQGHMWAESFTSLGTKKHPLLWSDDHPTEQGEKDSERKTYVPGNKNRKPLKATCDTGVKHYG